MICTEEEAKGKWCPQARVVAVDDRGRNSSPAAANRADGPKGMGMLPAARCIGSACMLWVDKGGDGYGKNLGTCGLIQRGGK